MSRKSLHDLLNQFESGHAVFPVVATEIEFTLHGASSHKEAAVLDALRALCEKHVIPLVSCEKERGLEQYEIALSPSPDVASVIAATDRLKTALSELESSHTIRADFSALPHTGEPGNGLHVHLHLEDETGKNIFTREGEIFSPALLHAIGGLLYNMKKDMAVFAPTDASRSRYVNAPHTPTTVSWGTNNRTVAIRLPTKPMDNKHIEHRVASADADIEAVITAILEGVLYGLEHACDPGEPVYGNASHEQYAKQKLL